MFVITLFSFLFVLFILVFFHELGHFLAAKSVGVRVEKFYIGFNVFGLGIKKQIGETEYGLGILPLG
ncbi:MAG: site-2 protease family protein, partial [Candidatus Marinimicrobia bacterium]|nr:site-2 protease family protein [Candidatus Neomarinimicrobiota bacterium]